MSPPTVRQKTGVVFALAVAFVLAVSAPSALGWGQEGKEQEHGKSEKEHGKKERPTAIVPETTKGDQPCKKRAPVPPEEEKGKGQKGPPAQSAPAAPTAVPPAPPAPAVTPTAAPPERVTAERTPSEKGGETPERVVAQAKPPTSQAAVPLAPVAERKELAETGIDPALIAFLGGLCLVGGGFLLRRALARG